MSCKSCCCTLNHEGKTTFQQTHLFSLDHSYPTFNYNPIISPSAVTEQQCPTTQTGAAGANIYVYICSTWEKFHGITQLISSLTHTKMKIYQLQSSCQQLRQGCEVKTDVSRFMQLIIRYALFLRCTRSAFPQTLSNWPCWALTLSLMVAENQQLMFAYQHWIFQHSGESALLISSKPNSLQMEGCKFKI